MTTKPQDYRNEEGFILVAALMILMILTVMGIAMNRNTTTEIQIAANDRLHKQTFYEADGATEAAAEVLEQNIACVLFAANAAGSKAIGGGNIALDYTAANNNGIAIDDGSLQLWQNTIGKYSNDGFAVADNYPSDAFRDMWLPVNYAAGAPHTNITVEGIADLTAGSSIIQAGGYLGLGRSMAAGGVTLEYEIDARHTGLSNSESMIRVEYRHVVGREDPFCKYD
ncbi:MAG: pilus assembly PilX N-terminal domain-containing protein [Desulforhopalus sp.]|nr:pilus assembly PilX N-terminal domain-containing protein [Desulforhopalus sp.]